MTKALLPAKLRRAGAVVCRDGQNYRLVRTESHQCRNGRITTLAVWRSKCAEGGVSFDFHAPIARLPENRLTEHPVVRLQKQPLYTVVASRHHRRLSH
jgi:hypothetical protein